MIPVVVAAALLAQAGPVETFTMRSRVLDEPRVINVYTPPGYDAAGAVRYPVLYMPDGGMAEDFPHVSGTVDSLIRLGEIPPMLVVGIENTERRRDVTGPTTVPSDSAIAPRVGGSAAFRRFIADELVPEVERRYRASARRAIVGESLAGLFVVETFLLEPAVFDTYVALSPSLWWNEAHLLADAPELLARHPGGLRTVYLAEAGEPGIAAETAELARLLEAHGGAGLVRHYVPRRDLEHATIYRGASPAAFVTVFGQRGEAP